MNLGEHHQSDVACSLVESGDAPRMIEAQTVNTTLFQQTTHDSPAPFATHEPFPVVLLGLQRELDALVGLLLLALNAA